MDTAFVLVKAIDGAGPRVAVKDVIDIAGYATRLGCRALTGVAPATRNAVVVDRLVSAACRIVGKTNLHELAFGVTGVNAWSGTPLNPRFPSLVPGGSSSGSASTVASGQVSFALGTDTGGSIRVPAACCGIVGMKPTFGRISRAGVHPAQSSLDCVGPMARQVARIEQALAIIDPTFAIAKLDFSPRLGVVEVDADGAVRSEVGAALDRVDAQFRTVELSHLGVAFAAGLTLIGAEAWAAYGHLLPTGQLGADVAQRLQAASLITPPMLDDAERMRKLFANEVDTALETVDALVLPTMPVLPPRLHEPAGPDTLRMTALVRPFNLSGHPAISLPIGGKPIGLQLVGRRGGDAELCAIARRVEAALLTHTPVPEFTS